MGEILNFASYPDWVRLAITVAAACLLCLLIITLFARIRRNNSAGLADRKTPPSEILPEPETILSSAHQNLSAHLSDIMRISSKTAQTTNSIYERKQSILVLRSAYSAKRALDNFAALEQVEKGIMKVDPQSKSFKPSMEMVIKKWKTMVRDQIEFTHFIDPILPDCIFIDHGRFTQIVENILNQSVSVTTKGRIHLHITGEPKPDSEWDLKLVLADTGSGIDPEALAQILEDKNPRDNELNAHTLNYRTSSELTKRIGGKFNIVSKQGRGTEIAITLPMRAANMFLDGQETLSGSPSEIGRLSGMRVLVIEDDKSSRNVLQTFLEPEGCVVHCISDGQDAIKTLNFEPDFDLIFMDIRMPGLNGIETTKLIRKSGMSYSKVPIIAITADTSAETNATAMMAGMDLFLNKPVSAKGLFGGISFVLDLQADIKAAAQ